MRRGRWMDHKALNICHIGQQGEYLQLIDKVMRLLLPAFDLKRENRGAALRKVSLIKCMIRMLR